MRLPAFPCAGSLNNMGATPHAPGALQSAAGFQLDTAESHCRRSGACLMSSEPPHGIKQQRPVLNVPLVLNSKYWHHDPINTRAMPHARRTHAQRSAVAPHPASTHPAVRCTPTASPIGIRTPSYLARFISRYPCNTHHARFACARRRCTHMHRCRPGLRSTAAEHPPTHPPPLPTWPVHVMPRPIATNQPAS